MFSEASLFHQNKPNGLQLFVVTTYYYLYKFCEIAIMLYILSHFVFTYF